MYDGCGCGRGGGGGAGACQCGTMCGEGRGAIGATGIARAMVAYLADVSGLTCPGLGCDDLPVELFDRQGGISPVRRAVEASGTGRTGR